MQLPYFVENVKVGVVGEGFSHQCTSKGNAQKHQQQIPGHKYKNVENRICKLMETRVFSADMWKHIFNVSYLASIGVIRIVLNTISEKICR